MTTELAARVTSKVAHTSSAATTAMTLGGVALGVLAVFFPPVGIVGTGALNTANFAFSTASLAASVGKVLDLYVLAESASEQIVKGVDSVSLEEDKHAAANVSDKTLTDEHAKSPATGSDSVFIENEPACRRGDKTKCDGLIVTGASHIYFGGSPTSDGKTAQYIPPWLYWLDLGISLGGYTTSATKLPLALRKDWRKELSSWRKAPYSAFKLGVDSAKLAGQLSGVAKDFQFVKSWDTFGKAFGWIK